MFLAMVWHGERRAAALESVRRASAREQDFVRAASHQLKTPLAIARGLASLMQTRSGDAPADQDLDDLMEELDRLARIADDLLLLAAAEQQNGLVRAEVDLEDLILVAATRRWGRTEDRRWMVAPCEGVLASADRYRLDAALDAVLENAVRATKAGDTISIACIPADDWAVIRIADSGVGMDADALAHVFERFWSMPYGEDPRRGTGLGLPIVEAIVRAHGGTVSIAAARGAGTTVSLRLPGFRPETLPAAAPVIAARQAAS
jgi:signal transduction histidine kinase